MFYSSTLLGWYLLRCGAGALGVAVSARALRRAVALWVASEGVNAGRFGLKRVLDSCAQPGAAGLDDQEPGARSGNGDFSGRVPSVGNGFDSDATLTVNQREVKSLFSRQDPVVGEAGLAVDCGGVHRLGSWLRVMERRRRLAKNRGLAVTFRTSRRSRGEPFESTVAVPLG